MQRLTFLLAAITALLAVVAPVRCGATEIRDPIAARNWKELRSTIEAGDARAVAAMLGKPIYLEGARDQTTPNRVGSADLPGHPWIRLRVLPWPGAPHGNPAQLLDKTWISVRVIPPQRASRAALGSRWVEGRRAVLTSFRILGTLHSIDLKKRELVVDPVRAEVFFVL